MKIKFQKFSFLLLLIVVSIKSFSQEFSFYNDTLNNFSIAIPKSWTYQANNNSSVKLIAFRTTQNNMDNVRETYNVNILPLPNSNIDSAYSIMLRSISTRQGYKFIEKGDTIINEKKYIWTIENHFNIKSQEEMTAYIYLGYYNDKAYMITFATVASSFEKYKEVFKNISWTFKI